MKRKGLVQVEDKNIDIEPPSGFSTYVKVVKVKDADTITVELTRRFDIRLTDERVSLPLIFDAPEKSTELGKASKYFATTILLGKWVKVFIPSGDMLKLMDINSFDRLLAAVWYNGKRFTSTLIDKGFGRFVRKDERKTKPWEC